MSFSLRKAKDIYTMWDCAWSVWTSNMWSHTPIWAWRNSAKRGKISMTSWTTLNLHLLEKIDHMKIVGILPFCWCHIRQFNCWSFYFRNLFVGLEQDQVIVRVEIKPWYIESYTLMSRSSSWDSNKNRSRCDSSTWSDLWKSNKRWETHWRYQT
jgi:hypothetical protein